MKHLATKLLFGVLIFINSQFQTESLLAQPSPIVCMPFNGSATDISGNNHHGFVDGATLTADRFGNPNSAFDFDGVDDHIELVDSIGSMFSNNELSIAFWAKTEATGNNSPFLLLPNDNNDRLNIHIHYDNNGTFSTFWDYGDLSNGGRLKILGVPFQSKWEHYVFVVSQSLDSMFIYKDGVLQQSKSGASVLIDRSRHLNIGGGISDITNCHFNGQIDDVQIFDVALNVAEVNDIYTVSNTCMNSLQNYIRGNIFYDFNSNFIQDAGEPSYGNSLLTELNTNRVFYSFPDGKYIFGIDSIGSFEISPPLNIQYYQTNPASQTATFSAIGQVDSLNDFAFQPVGVSNDLRVTLSPLSPFRPGFLSTYNIHFENIGNTILGGDLYFYRDPLLAFEHASVSPNINTSDSLVWAISPLNPFESGNIVVTSTLQIGTPNGTLINSLAKIEPIIGDAAPGNNYSSWEVFSIGSYDPNDISVNISSIAETQANNPPDLIYQIRFQNTGTDTAFTVVVENVLPIELVNSSFEFLNSSHTCSIDYNQNSRKIRFIFNNILLSDSNTNEATSHGFINYRIKPVNNLSLGNQIINNAEIFFDFNTAVTTNNALTEITSTTGLASVSSVKDLKLFPNPANEFLSITGLKADIYEISILDMKGASVYSSISNKTSDQPLQLDLRTISDGLYVVKFISKENVFTEKLIKQSH